MTTPQSRLGGDGRRTASAELDRRARAPGDRGASIGVPALIALSFCGEFPGGRRLAAVLSGRVPEEDDA